jgi:MFS family permease
MTSLSPSPLMVALVQSATTLPMFLLALPAGALADIIDRRALLIAAQIWVVVAAALLAAATFTGLTGPGLLLALTFAIACGGAMSAPAFQATVPELVARPALAQAVTLNSLGVNIARATGPALGGLVIAVAGSWAVFALNAVSVPETSKRAATFVIGSAQTSR